MRLGLSLPCRAEPAKRSFPASQPARDRPHTAGATAASPAEQQALEAQRKARAGEEEAVAAKEAADVARHKHYRKEQNIAQTVHNARKEVEKPEAAREYQRELRLQAQGEQGLARRRARRRAKRAAANAKRRTAWEALIESNKKVIAPGCGRRRRRRAAS